jgi:hypothetical protein
MVKEFNDALPVSYSRGGVLMNTSTRSVQVSTWMLIVLFGLFLLSVVLVVPLTTPGFRVTTTDLWWRLLVVGLTFLTYMILWNAYRATQRWSWTALLVTAMLLFGGGIVVQARLGDLLWLVVSTVELLVALAALAIPFREFFGT